MDLILGYLAGLLTLINPCVLPVLPIVLAGALQAGRFGPLALAGGMAVSFVALGLTVAAAGQALGLREEDIGRAGAVLMLGFGLVLLVPRAGAGFALATGGVAARADASLGQGRDGLAGQALAGVLLGAVWSPCIGPTLGAAIGLAAAGGSLVQAGAVMVAFAAGVGTLVLALGYGARGLLMRNRARAEMLARRAKPLMGLVFIAVGTAILTGFHHVVEGAILDLMPVWLQDLSVAI
jgi:cytochrome c-type biogenesis protein